MSPTSLGLLTTAPTPSAIPSALASFAIGLVVMAGMLLLIVLGDMLLDYLYGLADPRAAATAADADGPGHGDPDRREHGAHRPASAPVWREMQHTTLEQGGCLFF
jgi:hypothetical protein